MKQNMTYWVLFAPMIRRSISRRFSEELAQKGVREGKREYRELCARADELGPGNPMAMNAYFAYVFAGAWLGTGRAISPEEMGKVMSDVLNSPLLRFVFGLTNLNRKPKKWYNDMKKYEAWFHKHGKEYPANWNVRFDENKHETGSYYYFTRCPICEFCAREGLSELMPALCATDEVMFKLQHGVLRRSHTIAQGDGVCDYWIVGDQVQNPK